MRLDYLIERLLVSLAEERLLLRRLARFVLPLLLMPIGFALAQMARSWFGLAVGSFGSAVLLAQIELFLRPAFSRVRVIGHDIQFYLGADSSAAPAERSAFVPLLLPAAASLVASMALFLPSILLAAPAWRRLLALALGAGVLWIIGQRLSQLAVLLDRVEAHLETARRSLLAAPGGLGTAGAYATPVIPSMAAVSAVAPVSASVGERWSAAGGRAEDGLLDPAISRAVAGLPFPVLPISPAARALLRVEAYLLLRDFPATSDRALLDSLAGLANEAYRDELRHWLLPPVGGKLYLPIAANGTLASMLSATARRLGMDGGYSASLGTWLVRLPPARSYAVAGWLIDALVALPLPPLEAILPHHLTVQGDLGQASRLLSIVQLAATPLLFDERPGHASGDERLFIMRGGGVLDDMGGRGRHSGPRTDFVDGFVFVQTPGLSGVEHLAAHTINLRVKQVLAFGLLADARPLDRRAPVERRAALAFGRLRADMRGFLARYNLEAALEVSWLDGRWSEVWPWVRRLSELKEHDATFLDAAQQLRDHALDTLEQIAVDATKSIEDRR
jgi:hypothetical protein